MIYTEEQIDAKVLKVKGTWVKHRNLRNRLVAESNAEVQRQIDEIRKQVRKAKLNGAKEQDCRGLYAEITKLELRLL